MQEWLLMILWVCVRLRLVRQRARVAVGPSLVLGLLCNFGHFPERQDIKLDPEEHKVIPVGGRVQRVYPLHWPLMNPSYAISVWTV